VKEGGYVRICQYLANQICSFLTVLWCTNKTDHHDTTEIHLTTSIIFLYGKYEEF
jgi:hypothetical protein